jgi:hypothetical protein
MTVELMFGAAMAFILGYFFYNLEQKRGRKREQYAIKRIIPLMENIEETAHDIDRYLIARQNKMTEMQEVLFGSMIVTYRAFGGHLDKFVSSVSDDIDLDLRDELISLIHLVEGYCNVYENTKRLKMPYSPESPTDVIQLITKLKKKLNDLL